MVSQTVALAACPEVAARHSQQQTLRTLLPPYPLSKHRRTRKRAPAGAGEKAVVRKILPSFFLLKKPLFPYYLKSNHPFMRTIALSALVATVLGCSLASAPAGH